MKIRNNFEYFISLLILHQISHTLFLYMGSNVTRCFFCLVCFISSFLACLMPSVMSAVPMFFNIHRILLFFVAWGMVMHAHDVFSYSLSRSTLSNFQNQLCCQFLRSTLSPILQMKIRWQHFFSLLHDEKPLSIASILCHWCVCASLCSAVCCSFVISQGSANFLTPLISFFSMTAYSVVSTYLWYYLYCSRIFISKYDFCIVTEVSVMKLCSTEPSVLDLH